jgi:hypothetical protein
MKNRHKMVIGKPERKVYTDFGVDQRIMLK